MPFWREITLLMQQCLNKIFPPKLMFEPQVLSRDFWMHYGLWINHVTWTIGLWIHHESRINGLEMNYDTCTMNQESMNYEHE